MIDEGHLDEDDDPTIGLKSGKASRFGPPRQIVRKIAVQIATEKSWGNTTVTCRCIQNLRKTCGRQGREHVGAKVFTGKIVRGRVLPMKKAWRSSGGPAQRCRPHYIAQAGEARHQRHGENHRLPDDLMELPENEQRENEGRERSRNIPG